MRLVLLAAALLGLSAAPAERPSWVGTWTFDLCHEDRRADHDNDTYCREGRDRIRIEADASGSLDITLCPVDPWGERRLRIEDGGRHLEFRTRDNMDVRLSLGEDRDHYRGIFRTPDGHTGRVWGRRVAGCG